MPELTVQKNSTKKLSRFDGSPKASKKRAPETNATSPQTPENRSHKRRRPRAIHVDDSDDGKTSETSNEILNEISPAVAAVDAVDAADVPAATSEHATSLVAASPIQGDAVKANAPKTIAAVARDSQRDAVDNNVAPRRDTKGIFAIAKPANPVDQKLATVKAAIALLQSAFDVPNVNELDGNDKIRLRETFIEATQVYAHDTLVLRSYDRANDENDWTQLIKHVTAVKGMLKTTQASLERQAQEGPPKASLPQKKYLQTLGYDENAPGNTKLSELTMDEARMLITSLKAAKLFREK